MADCPDEKSTSSYQRHRFPFEIISPFIWLYYRFCVSFREVEGLLVERGITVTYETIRQWCQQFDPDYAHKLKKPQSCLGDTWHIDEVFITIQGQRQYGWCTVDQDGDPIDILVQPGRNQRTEERFCSCLLKGQGSESRGLVTDKLRSYDAAHRTVMSTVCHDNHRYANNPSGSLPPTHPAASTHEARVQIPSSDSTILDDAWIHTESLSPRPPSLGGGQLSAPSY